MQAVAALGAVCCCPGGDDHRFVGARSKACAIRGTKACDAAQQRAGQTGAWRWLGRFPRLLLVSAPICFVITL
jgi:hypothetical protein